MVYPTHPYTTRQTYKNLRFLSDPSTIKINGVTIGISSTDILSHISEAELVKYVLNTSRCIAYSLFLVVQPINGSVILIYLILFYTGIWATKSDERSTTCSIKLHSIH